MPPRIAYYADDFTGATDVLEGLQWAGISTVLFLGPPTQRVLDAFPSVEAFGIAGRSRSMSPEQMEHELRPSFKLLKESGAAIVHYKTCSTFDSSPSVGSIGKAIEIGREVFAARLVPIVIGAPHLGRYQVFGNLFAQSGLGTETHRLDRHPTMAFHPITPMNEADMRRHLSLQTTARIGLCDVLQLDSIPRANDIMAQAENLDAMLFDILNEQHLLRVGEILDEMACHQTPLFVVGSSGVEYALTKNWLDKSPRGRAQPTSLDPVEQILVITGSCSPVNARQVHWSEKNGFATLPLDTARLLDPKTSKAQVESAISDAIAILNRGESLIIHSSLGPGDARIAATNAELKRQGLSEHEIRMQSGELLGSKLGEILKGTLREHPLPRVGIAGGDSSGFIARELELTALEAIAPVTPGAPLCRAHAENELNDLQLVFKGGQVGGDDIWEKTLIGAK